ncbi:MAG TPA: pilus assembly protein TadG-related protein [Kineosporiaceae bacterium]|nr:pilus assembly protein TadG-related protein [Kineosporiaceae bacterium]
MAELVLTRRTRPGARDDRGAVAVLVAVFVTVLLGLCAIVVDLGLARAMQRDAQTASDSAALAAATTMQGLMFLSNGSPSATKLTDAEGQAVTAAKTYARLNLGIADADWKGCSDPHALGDTPDAGAGNTCISFGGGLVRVVLPQQNSPSIFSGVFGTQRIGYGSTSTGQWELIPSASCWLCVQGQAGGVGLDIGDGTAWESSGDVRVGTRVAATVSARTGWMWALSGRILYTGGTPTNAWRFFPVPQTTSTTSAVTTLANANTWVGQSVSTSPAGPECRPGVYNTVEHCVQFFAGTYVLTGSTDFTGTASVSSMGPVTFYLTCSHEGRVTPCGQPGHGSPGGSLTWSASASLNLSGPATDTALPATITVDPDNTSPQVLVKALTNAASRAYITGGIFAPGSSVVVQSTPGAPWWTADLDVDGPITVDRLTLSGSGALFSHHGTPPATGSPTKVPVHLVD